MKGYLNLNELVEYSGRSERTLRRLIRAGLLRAFRAGDRGRLFVRPEWYDDYVEEVIRQSMTAEADAGDRVVGMADELWRKLTGDAA